MLHLAGDLVREDIPAPIGPTTHDGGRRLVAGGLDSKDKHRVRLIFRKDGGRSAALPLTYRVRCASSSEEGNDFQGRRGHVICHLRLGSRGSPLALAQTMMTRASLASLTGESEERFPVTIIKTSGDIILDRALAESGGKGLFTKEIDEAQLAGAIDLSIHSGKDLPTALPPGLSEAGYLPRADVRDAFIGRTVKRLIDLPHGARLGTASLRRGAQALRLRPILRSR